MVLSTAWPMCSCPVTFGGRHDDGVGLFVRVGFGVEIAAVQPTQRSTAVLHLAGVVLFSKFFHCTYLLNLVGTGKAAPRNHHGTAVMIPKAAVPPILRPPSWRAPLDAPVTWGPSGAGCPASACGPDPSPALLWSDSTPRGPAGFHPARLSARARSGAHSPSSHLRQTKDSRFSSGLSTPTRPAGPLPPERLERQERLERFCDGERWERNAVSFLSFFSFFSVPFRSFRSCRSYR